MARPSHVLAVLLGFAGIVLLVAGALALPYLLFIILLATAVPDALAPEGDPCCSMPDTWGEVALGVVYASAATAIDAALLCAGTWLVRKAAGAEEPGGRWVLLLPLIAAGIVAAGLVIAIVPRAGQARLVSSSLPPSGVLVIDGRGSGVFGRHVPSRRSDRVSLAARRRPDGRPRLHPPRPRRG